MSSFIICPTRNNLSLLKRAIATFRAQDIGDVALLILDNGSTDGTTEWLATQPDIFTSTHRPGLSVAASWNLGLDFAFDFHLASYALVVNNDVELRPDTYRHLVADGGPFVTAVGVQDPRRIEPNLNPSIPREHDVYLDPDPAHKSPHPDFSCFLIRRETWARVGRFDENFKTAFCEDWDYHVRLHEAGIRAECLDLPYLHLGSQTVKNADDAERTRIHAQAELNRDYFAAKWGVRGGTPEYYALFDSTPAGPDPIGEP